jgi:hypothetical protein
MHTFKAVVCFLARSFIPRLAAENGFASARAKMENNVQTESNITINVYDNGL